jgi:hypothetical protein
MRISLFESSEAILLKILDAPLSEIASRIDSLDTGMLDLLLKYGSEYKFIVGETYKKYPKVVIS